MAASPQRPDFSGWDWRAVDAWWKQETQRRFTALSDDQQIECREALRWIDLAHYKLEQCDYENATRLFYEAFKALQQLLCDEYPIMASNLHNLAYVLQTRGALSQAEALYRQALDMRQRLFPGNHRDVAQSLNNLGFVLQEQGALSLAEGLYRQALDMRRRLFPGNPRDVANSLNNLAVVLQARGDLLQAEGLLRQALDMRRWLFLNNDHPDMAQSLNNLASVLQARGTLPQAEDLYRQALDMRQRLFPGDHRDVAISLNNLASVLQARGTLPQAEDLYRQALDMWRRLFPGDHRDVAISLNNLASVLGARSDLPEAEKLYRQALDMVRRLFPGHHPNVAISLNNLAYVLIARAGRDLLVEAEGLLRESFKMLETLRTDVIGAEHERSLWAGELNHAATAAYLARVLLAQRKDAEAFTFAERGRGRALLDLLARADRDLLAEARAAADAAQLAELERRLQAEDAARSARATAEAELAATMRRADLPPDEKNELAAGQYAELAAARNAEADAERGVFALLRQVWPDAQPLDAAAVQAALEPGELVLCYGWTDDFITLLIVPPAGGDVRGFVLLEGREAVARFAESAWETRARLAGEYAAGTRNVPEKPFSDPSRDREGAEAAKNPAAGRAPPLPHGRGSDGKESPRDLFPHDLFSYDLFLHNGLRALFETLLPAEARAQLLAAKRWIVLPAGPLDGIPFETLAAGGTAERPRLLRDCGPAIVYAESATIYANRRRERPRRAARWAADDWPAVALGDPKFYMGSGADGNSNAGADAGAGVTASAGGNAGTGIRFGKSAPHGAAETSEPRPSGSGPHRKPPDFCSSPLPDGRGSDQEASSPPRSTDLEARTEAQADAQADAEFHYEDAEAGAEGGTELQTLMQKRDAGRATVAEIHLLDWLRLFGGFLRPLPGTKWEAKRITTLLRKKIGLLPSMTGAAPQTIGAISAAAFRAATPAITPATTSHAPTLLLGEDATLRNLEAAIRAIGAGCLRIVHFATHGLTGSRQKPHHAALALTPPAVCTDDDFGFLTLDRLMRKWRRWLEDCELVVLSACDTQRGARAGDSAMALPWGFLYAGAATVVASLWKVDDVATAFLMERFYENLLGLFETPRGEHAARRPMTKLDALREARRWLSELSAGEIRRKLGLAGAEHDAKWAGWLERRAFRPASPAARLFASPSFWAAFILIGDPE